MKRIVIAAVLLAAVLALASAQTAAQQRELEQIARRSANGLSAADRARVVQIMTDTMVAQGMSRSQAAALAEANVDGMFSADAGEATAEQRRMFEETQRASDAYDQMMRPDEANNVWPAAQDFARYGSAITRPAVNYVGTIKKEGETLTIEIRHPYASSLHLAEPGFRGYTQAEITAICRVFEAQWGAVDNQGKNWRDSVIRGAPVDLEKRDPRLKSTDSTGYFIHLHIEPRTSAGYYLGMTITLAPRVTHYGQ